MIKKDVHLPSAKKLFLYIKIFNKTYFSIYYLKLGYDFK